MSFLGEVKKGASSVQVMWNEAPVEICESQEGSYVFDCRGDGPVCEPSYLDWVHGQGSGFDYHSKVFYLGDIEGTFL